MKNFTKLLEMTMWNVVFVMELLGHSVKSYVLNAALTAHFGTTRVNIYGGLMTKHIVLETPNGKLTGEGGRNYG